jgi:flagellar basal-body M-ring protein/flagellar hook-basal body protein (fliF)
MDEQLKKFAQKLAGGWKAYSRRKQFLIVGAIAAGLIVLIVVVAALNTTQYELLYSGLSTSEAGQIYNAVSAQNVPVKVEGTDIYVQKGKADALRMQMAESNLPQGNLPYNIYDSGNNFAETDTDKAIKQLQQTQDRLQSTIETIPGVSNAIVNIAQNNDNTYVLETDKTATTASVKLTLDNNVTLTKSQVDGIVRLVAGSVSGLSSDNVTVTDTYGNILNDNNSVDGNGDASEQLLEKSQYEQTIRQKVVQLLGRTYGDSNVNVVVNADLDFSSVSTVTNSYTSGIINYTQVSSSVTSNTSGVITGSSASGTLPTYSNTSTVPGGQFTSNFSKTDSALIGSVQQATQKNGPTLKKLSIAVLLNTYNPMVAGANAAALKQTIADATGAAVANISLQQLTFSSASVPSSSSAVSSTGFLIPSPNGFLYIIVAGALLLIVLLSLLLVLLNARKKKREAAQAALEAAQAEAQAAAQAALENQVKKPLDPLKSIEEQLAETEGNTMKKQIEDFTDKKPELVAQILKNWLKD